jgi:histone H3/H4
VELFRLCNKLAQHSKRDTIMLKDLNLAKNLKDLE